MIVRHQLDKLDYHLQILVKTRISSHHFSNMELYCKRCDNICVILSKRFKNFIFSSRLLSYDSNDEQKIIFEIKIDDDTMYTKTLTFNPFWDDDNNYQFIGWVLKGTKYETI